MEPNGCERYAQVANEITKLVAQRLFKHWTKCLIEDVGSYRSTHSTVNACSMARFMAKNKDISTQVTPRCSSVLNRRRDAVLPVSASVLIG